MNEIYNKCPKYMLLTEHLHFKIQIKNNHLLCMYVCYVCDFDMTQKDSSDYILMYYFKKIK